MQAFLYVILTLLLVKLFWMFRFWKEVEDIKYLLKKLNQEKNSK